LGTVRAKPDQGKSDRPRRATPAGHDRAVGLEQYGIRPPIGPHLQRCKSVLAEGVVDRAVGVVATDREDVPCLVEASCDKNPVVRLKRERAYLLRVLRDAICRHHPQVAKARVRASCPEKSRFRSGVQYEQAERDGRETEKDREALHPTEAIPVQANCLGQDSAHRRPARGPARSSAPVSGKRELRPDRILVRSAGHHNAATFLK
jgi:hypothetical protein